MIKCYNCNTTLPDKAKFCKECGAKQTKVCPSCKAFIVDEGSRFCMECGESLVGSDEGVKNEEDLFNRVGLCNSVTLKEFRNYAASLQNKREKLLELRGSLNNIWDYNGFVSILLGISSSSNKPECKNLAIGQGDNKKSVIKNLNEHGLVKIFEKYKNNKINDTVSLDKVQEEIIKKSPEFTDICQRFNEIVFSEEECIISEQNTDPEETIEIFTSDDMMPEIDIDFGDSIGVIADDFADIDVGYEEDELIIPDFKYHDDVADDEKIQTQKVKWDANQVFPSNEAVEVSAKIEDYNYKGNYKKRIRFYKSSYSSEVLFSVTPDTVPQEILDAFQYKEFIWILLRTMSGKRISKVKMNGNKLVTVYDIDNLSTIDDYNKLLMFDNDIFVLLGNDKVCFLGDNPFEVSIQKNPQIIALFDDKTAVIKDNKHGYYFLKDDILTKLSDLVDTEYVVNELTNYYNSSIWKDEPWNLKKKIDMSKFNMIMFANYDEQCVYVKLEIPKFVFFINIDDDENKERKFFKNVVLCIPFKNNDNSSLLYTKISEKDFTYEKAKALDYKKLEYEKDKLISWENAKLYIENSKKNFTDEYRYNLMISGNNNYEHAYCSISDNIYAIYKIDFHEHAVIAAMNLTFINGRDKQLVALDIYGKWVKYCDYDYQLIPYSNIKQLYSKMQDWNFNKYIEQNAVPVLQNARVVNGAIQKYFLPNGDRYVSKRKKFNSDELVSVKIEPSMHYYSTEYHHDNGETVGSNEPPDIFKYKYFYSSSNGIQVPIKELNNVKAISSSEDGMYYAKDNKVYFKNLNNETSVYKENCGEVTDVLAYKNFVFITYRSFEHKLESGEYGSLHPIWDGVSYTRDSYYDCSYTVVYDKAGNEVTKLKKCKGVFYICDEFLVLYEIDNNREIKKMYYEINVNDIRLFSKNETRVLIKNMPLIDKIKNESSKMYITCKISEKELSDIQFLLFRRGELYFLNGDKIIKKDYSGNILL